MAAAAKKARKKTTAAKKPRIQARKKTGNMKGGVPPHPTGPKNKADAVEMAFRIRIVEECLIAGKRGSEIVEALANAGRVVAKRSVEDYIRKVREKWLKEDQLHAPATRARQLRELYRTIRLMVEDRAWSPYVKAHQLLAQLEGNYPTEETGAQEQGEFVGWSQTELDRYIESNGRDEPLWMKKAREAVHGPMAPVGAMAPNERRADDQAIHKPEDVLH